MNPPDHAYLINVVYRRVTGRHYVGERDTFVVTAATEGAARAIIRHQLRGTGAEIVATMRTN